MDPWTKAIIALASFMFGKNGGDKPDAAPMSPEMRTMFNLELKKQRSQIPLYNNVLRMSNQMLPKWARQQNVTGMADNGLSEPGDPGTDTRGRTDTAEETGRHAIPRF